MADIKHAARLLGLAVTRPVEFSDRLAGRRERANEAASPRLDAEVRDPVRVAHDLVDAGGVECCAPLSGVRSAVFGRVASKHHHDAGSSLAEMLWVFVRHCRPTVVVETGVARGVSSAFILDALCRNDHGHLWSIDLPPVTPDWGEQTGMAVPADVRRRWTYVRGAARRKLPKVLSTCGPVGMFVHDGLHTTDNMLFEMRSVWPHLEHGGLLVSDDAGASAAVPIFSREIGVEPILVREPGKDSVLAVIRRD